MKKIGKILLFTSLLILLIGIVSASEVTPNDNSGTNDAIIAHDTNTVSQSDTQKNLEEAKTNKSTPKTIKKNSIGNSNVKKDNQITVSSWDALKGNMSDLTSQSGDTTIRLNGGTYTNTGTITWRTSGIVLTIDGNGQTIDGKQKRVFNIDSGCSLVLKNITITNSKASNGGAIYNQGTVTITDSTLNNNKAEGEFSGGGAIYNQGTVTITDSTLNNNKAEGEFSEGGAIYNNGGIVTITNHTTIQNNTATRGGAIRNNIGTVTITNHTTIQNNTATQTGGAISNIGGTVTITNHTTIQNNTATQNGGAIDNNIGNLTIINTTLTNNTATRGGAINDETSEYYDSMVVLYNSTFKENKATNGAVIQNGGGYGKYNITFNKFQKNTANQNKETLDLGTNNREKTIEENTYENTDISITTINLTTVDEKTKYTTDEDITLNFTIELEHPESYDMDILEKINKTLYINDEKLTTTKYENYTLSDLEPGEYTVYFTSCNQQSNTVTFKVIGDLEVNVTNYTQLVEAIGNATRDEYNIYKINLQPGYYNATQSIDWKDSTTRKIIINGNNNTLDGQNTHQFIKIAQGHNLTLENIAITNYNSSLGGAIDNTGNLTIINTALTNNTADWDGGAIYNNGGTLTITNHTTLQNNNATQTGGAIYNYNGIINIANTIIQNNNADSGGAIDNYNGIVTITNHTTIQNNTAFSGGAIDNLKGIINIANTIIQNNTATGYGGAIDNYNGTVTITNHTTIQNNTAFGGGAIYNLKGIINITNTALNNNTATSGGGAICDITSEGYNTMVVLYNSTFTENKAARGAVIQNSGGYGKYNITFNKFQKNIASENNETLYLGENIKEITIEDNTYENTDISITTINLATMDKKTKYTTDEEITLNFTIELEYPESYDEDILEKINKTLYINGQENITTNEMNITLNKLIPKEYTAYYKTYYGQSNNLTFTVKYESQIKTDKNNYEHYDGIKNTITLNITDPSEEKGTINIRVKDPDGYKNLSTYSNVGNEYQLSTDTLVEALENLYTDIDDAYTINITYTSNNKYTNPSSTEFTLNIIQKRNTTITYEIINNTEGNVQISITVLDSVYKTPVPDAQIIITGAINNETTAGIITDNTLTPGDYTITVNFNGTDDYNKSNTTIDFTVEIDKDKKIEELEGNVTNLTDNLKDAQQEIQNLTNTNNQLKEQLNTVLKTIENLNTTINNLTKQLENAQQEIQNLNQTITELNKTMNTTITIKPVTSSVGSQLNLTATITDEEGNNVTTGKVLFKVNGITLKDTNGNVIYAIVNNGEATLTTKTQAAWIKNTTQIQAVYSGEKPYKSSRANTTNINISKGKATITLEEKSITAKAGQTITLKAKVLDSNGDRVNNDKVVFKLNGRTLTDKNGTTLYARVIDGEAVLEYTIPETYNAKTYNLTVVFGGNYYERTQTQGTLLLEKKATTITPENINTNNGTTTIKATIRDETGNTLISTTKVVIKINGKTITTTNSTNGTIDTSFTTTLRPGTYELTIISGENGQYQKATLTTALKI